MAADAIVPGAVLAGRYRVNRRLGSGGMGEVWAAEDAELGMPVAIKVVPPILARNVRAVGDLRREAQIAIRLSHPNICRLHTFHSDGALKFLVMEHLSGRTLEDLLACRADRRMTWEELKPIAEQVAAALDYAHSLDPPVLHRDIKPANIMLCPSGSTWTGAEQGAAPKGRLHAILLDFGIAREMRSSLTRVTGRDDTSGTMPYMSPEQFRGQRCDARSDVYSLCTVLYEALAGEPFVDVSGSISWQVQEKLFQPIVGVPEEANRLLAAGLAKDAARRPARLNFGAAGAAAPAAQEAVAARPAAAPVAPVAPVPAPALSPAAAMPACGPPAMPPLAAPASGWSVSPIVDDRLRPFSALLLAFLMTIGWVVIGAAAGGVLAGTKFHPGLLGLLMATTYGAVAASLIRMLAGNMHWRGLLLLLPWYLHWAYFMALTPAVYAVCREAGIEYPYSAGVAEAGGAAVAAIAMGLLTGVSQRAMSIGAVIANVLGWVLVTQAGWWATYGLGEFMRGEGAEREGVIMATYAVRHLILGAGLGLTIGAGVKLARAKACAKMGLAGVESGWGAAMVVFLMLGLAGAGVIAGGVVLLAGHARETARSQLLTQRIRQFSTAATAFAMHGKGVMPSADGFPAMLAGEYHGNMEADRHVGGRSIVMNRALSWQSLSALPNTNMTVVFFEAPAGHSPGGGMEALPAQPLSPAGYVIGFADGSVRHVPKAEAGHLVWMPGAAFWPGKG
jgi:serine/threonine protein kinase